MGQAEDSSVDQPGRKAAFRDVFAVDLSGGIERSRRLTFGTGPFVDSRTLWDFAAVWVLPPALACALIIVLHTAAWPRVWRGRRPLYRWVFSDATVLLATLAAAPVLRAGTGPHRRCPSWVHRPRPALVPAVNTGRRG